MQKLSILAMLIITGCQCEPVQIPVPVEVPGPVQYVPFPELPDCPSAFLLTNDMTGGQFLLEARHWQDRALCLSGQMDSLKRLGQKEE